MKTNPFAALSAVALIAAAGGAAKAQVAQGVPVAGFDPMVARVMVQTPEWGNICPAVVHRTNNAVGKTEAAPICSLFDLWSDQAKQDFGAFIKVASANPTPGPDIVKAAMAKLGDDLVAQTDDLGGEATNRYRDGLADISTRRAGRSEDCPAAVQEVNAMLAAKAHTANPRVNQLIIGSCERPETAGAQATQLRP